MAWLKVQQIGEYGVLLRRDTFYITHHSALKQRRIYRSLFTKDLATAVAAVKHVAEIRAERLPDAVR